MSGRSSSSPSSPPAGSAGFSGFVESLRAGWRGALLRFALGLLAASLLWAVLAPAFAAGLARLGRPLIGLLEGDGATRYEVVGGRVIAQRRVWLPGQQRMVPVAQPLWVGVQNFGLPLLTALVLATPAWPWRRRARALGWGLGLLALTQVAHFLVAVEATQQSPILSPEGPVFMARASAVRQPVFYALYYFFELMGRGFFALLIYAGLVGLLRDRPARPPGGARRNDPCPCGSGRKYKRCHGAGAG